MKFIFKSDIDKKALAAVVTAGLLVVATLANLPVKASAEIPSCPLGAQTDRVMIDFTDTAHYLLSNGTEAQATAGPFAANLPAADYQVTLVSYDDHQDKLGQVQPQESFRLILKDAAGATVATTNAIGDLPQDLESKTEVVNSNLTLSRAVTQVVVFHAAYPDATGNPNSIVPICAAFDKKTVSVYDFAVTKLVKNITTSTSFSAETPAKPGETVEFQITVKNTGNVTATGVKVKDVLPDKLVYQSNSFKLGDVNVALEDFFGSGKTLGNLNVNETATIVFRAEVRDASNFQVGTTDLINTATGFNDQASKQATAKVKVLKEEALMRNLTITKRVQNISDNTSLSTSVNADSGEKVKFQIIFTTTGNASQHNVILKDALPSGLNFIAGTMRLDSNTVSNETDLFSATGKNFATLPQNETHTITFEADVTSTSSVTLTNTAEVRSDEVSAKQDSAQVVVQTLSLSRDLTIQKRVQNVTDNTSYSTSVSADPGERVRYEIVVTTTGNASQTNVNLRDIISDSRLSFISGTMRLDNSAVSQESNLFASGFNLGTLSQNTTKTLTFEANVASSGSFTSGTTATLPNTAYVRSDQISEKSSGANVTVNVATNQNRDLTIRKRVLNLTKNESSFQSSATANPGDRVKFELYFTTTGDALQNNVILRDILPSQLVLTFGSLRVDGASVNYESDFFGSGYNFGTLSANTSRTVTFEAVVAGASVFSGTTTVTNTTNVRSDQVSTRQTTADVVVQPQTGTQFTLRKTAFNITQGVSATTVTANPGDLISYTLYYKNTGQATIQGAVIEDDIRDVLELAQITDQGGAVSVNGSIRYAPVDVVSGVEIAKTFQVRVNDASSFPSTSDLVMVNVYGNEVRVLVRRPQVIGVITPPRTGAGEWVAAVLAGIATLGYWVYRRRIKFSVQ